MEAILIKDNIEDRVCIGFINSIGEYEYTIYTAFDGGVIEDSQYKLRDTLVTLMNSDYCEEYTIKRYYETH